MTGQSSPGWSRPTPAAVPLRCRRHAPPGMSAHYALRRKPRPDRTGRPAIPGTSTSIAAGHHQGGPVGIPRRFATAAIRPRVLGTGSRAPPIRIRQTPGLSQRLWAISATTSSASTPTRGSNSPTESGTQKPVLSAHWAQRFPGRNRGARGSTIPERHSPLVRTLPQPRCRLGRYEPLARSAGQSGAVVRAPDRPSLPRTA